MLFSTLLNISLDFIVFLIQFVQINKVLNIYKFIYFVQKMANIHSLIKLIWQENFQQIQ